MAPRPSTSLIVAALMAALGTCAIFAAVTVPTMLGAVSTWLFAGGDSGLVTIAIGAL